MSTNLHIHWNTDPNETLPVSSIVVLHLGKTYTGGLALSGEVFSTVSAWRYFLNRHAASITVVDEAGLLTSGTEFLTEFESLVATSYDKRGLARRHVPRDIMTILDGPPADRVPNERITWFDPEGPVFVTGTFC